MGGRALPFVAALLLLAAVITADKIYTLCDHGAGSYALIQMDLATGTKLQDIPLDPINIAMVGSVVTFGMHVNTDGKLYFSYSDEVSGTLAEGLLVRRFDSYFNHQVVFASGYKDFLFAPLFPTSLTGDCQGVLYTMANKNGVIHSLNTATVTSKSTGLVSLWYGSDVNNLAFNKRSGHLGQYRFGATYGTHNNAWFFADHSLSAQTTTVTMVSTTSNQHSPFPFSTDQYPDVMEFSGDSQSLYIIDSGQVLIFDATTHVNTRNVTLPYSVCFGITLSTNPCSNAGLGTRSVPEEAGGVAHETEY